MPRGKQGARRRPAVVPGGAGPYDALVGLFTEIVRQEVQAVMPRLATVKGLDGDGKNVRVQPWGEDVESDEGRPHGGGKKRSGDLVLLFPVGGGNEVAIGPIINTERANRETVGADEIERDAIDERHLRQNAIHGRHLAAGVIGERELGRNFINRAMLTNDLGNEIGGKVDRSAFDTRMRGVDDKFKNVYDRIKKIDGGGGGPRQGGQGQS